VVAGLSSRRIHCDRDITGRRQKLNLHFGQLELRACGSECYGDPCRHDCSLRAACAQERAGRDREGGAFESSGSVACGRCHSNGCGNFLQRPVKKWPHAGMTTSPEICQTETRGQAARKRKPKGVSCLQNRYARSVSEVQPSNNSTNSLRGHQFLRRL
jgi:hypothetical protein